MNEQPPFLDPEQIDEILADASSPIPFSDKPEYDSISARNPLESSRSDDVQEPLFDDKSSQRLLQRLAAEDDSDKALIDQTPQPPVGVASSPDEWEMDEDMFAEQNKS